MDGSWIDRYKAAFQSELGKSGWSTEGAAYLVEQVMTERFWEAFKRFGEAHLKGTTRKVLKAPIPPDIRWAVWERDNYTCKWCGTRKHLAVDHIIPESKGGTLDLDNLQTLCRSCNSSKGAR